MATKELRIRYVGDASGVQKALGQIDRAHQTFGQKLQAIGRGVSRVGKGMTVGLTAPLVLFGKTAVDEFGESQKVIGQTSAAIKSTGGAAGVTVGQVGKLAEKIGHLAGVEDEVVQEGQNMLLTFTNIQNRAGKGNDIFNQTSMVMADVAARMKTDMSSAALQLGKALNNPEEGLSRLSRIGVDFTRILNKNSEEAQLLAARYPQLAKAIDQNRLTEEKAIEVAAKHGDTALAQRIMLRELQIEFGGSAKAMGNALTPTEKMRLAFSEIAETVGRFLVPMLSKLGTWVGKVGDWFDRLSPAGKRTAVTVLAIVAAIGPALLIIGKLISILGTLIPVIRAVSVALMANPFVAIAAAIAVVVTLIITNWDKIKAFLLKVWDAIKAAAKAVWDGIKAVIVRPVQAVWDFIKKALGVIGRIWRAGWEAVRSVARAIWQGVKTVVLNPLQAIWDFIKRAVTAIRDVWRRVWGGVKDFFRGVWDAIKSIAKAGANFVIGAINGVIKGLNYLLRQAASAYARLSNLFPQFPQPGTGGPVQIPLIPKLQRGGRFLAAGAAIVGEQGPEIGFFPRGAQVAPLDRAPGLGGDVHVSVTVQGSVIAERDLARTVRDELLRMRRRIPGLGLG